MATSEMKILRSALIKYKNKEYQEALVLFKQAANLYGENLVKANLEMCNRALRKIGKSPPPVAEFDAATKLMLANVGALQLSEEDRQETLKKWGKATARKSEDADVKQVNPIPSDWPPDLTLAPLPEGPNDFYWNKRRKKAVNKSDATPCPKLSVIIPTFNRSHILDITLACLVNQDTRYAFEVIVADDGSQEPILDVVRKYEALLDIKYVRQKDYGYQLCAVRNLGLRTAKYDFVSILDCDMAPNPKWVESYIELLMDDDDVALIGPRKYVDTRRISAEDILADPALVESLPEIITSNVVAGKTENFISVDWRLEHFANTDNLRLCDAPFRFFSGGNVAFAKKWIAKAGGFDEEFTHWGGEDNEFGYRLFRKGCFFRAVPGGLAYHQEPPGKENETDRAEGKKITIELVKEKVPYFYRKLLKIDTAKIYKAPLVSIYIPAYNCAEYIIRCVDSALYQTITDLEVCICDDGSTDGTLEVLRTRYGANPRVLIHSKENGGIGSASNAALSLARGFYIGQLDSDDYLEPDAVEVCLKEFLKNRSLACVYTTNRNVKPNGELIAKGYNWPVFSREKLTTAMIAHHFRMFTIRAWNLTEGFDETIENAVDYDMFLKLSEVGEFKHVNKISYNRVLHGQNTSIKNTAAQKTNHFVCVNKSLRRQNVGLYRYQEKHRESQSDRSYFFERLSNDTDKHNRNC